MIKPPLDVSAAARLSSSFQLRDIVCVALEAKHLAPANPPTGWALAWETPPVQVVWELEGDGLKVILPFSLFIEAHPNGDGDKKRKKISETDEKNVRLAEITVAMRIEYGVTRGESWSDDDVPHYAGITSYLHAWPYFRAEVQSLSTKLGYPPLLLPVIVSGHAAKQSTVVRLGEIRNAPPLPRRQPRTKKKVG